MEPLDDFQTWVEKLTGEKMEGQALFNAQRALGDEYQKYVDNYTTQNYGPMQQDGQTLYPFNAPGGSLPDFSEYGGGAPVTNWNDKLAQNPEIAAILKQGTTGADGVTYVTPGQWSQINTIADRLQSQAGGVMKDFAPAIFAAMVAGGAGLSGLGGGAAAGAGAGAAGGLGAADLAGLAQMAADAGLTGSAAANFVASGGTLGSTAAAAGGGGLVDMFGPDTTYGNAPGIGNGQIANVGADASTGLQPYSEYGGSMLPSGTQGLIPPGTGILDILQNIPPGATTALQQLVQQTERDIGGGVNQGPVSPSDLTSGVGPGQSGQVVGGPLSGIGASALKWLSEATGLSEGALRTIGTVGQAGIGTLAGLQQSSATNQLGNRILDLGAKGRERLEGSFTDPNFNLWDQPAYKGALDTSWKTGLHELSATGSGNPFGTPTGLAALNEKIMGGLMLPALRDYREVNRATGYGNIPQYAQVAQNAIGQQGGAWEAAGAGLQSLLNPRQTYTLADLKSLFS